MRVLLFRREVTAERQRKRREVYLNARMAWREPPVSYNPLDVGLVKIKELSSQYWNARLERWGDNLVMRSARKFSCLPSPKIFQKSA